MTGATTLIFLTLKTKAPNSQQYIPCRVWTLYTVHHLNLHCTSQDEPTNQLNMSNRLRTSCNFQLVLCCISICINLVFSATIQGTLSLPPHTTTGTTTGPLPTLNATRVTLNAGEYSTYTTASNTFAFHNIPTGVHSLTVHHPIYHFSQVKIQVTEDIKCIEYMYAGAQKRSIEHPLELSALATIDYFEPKPSFSPFRMLKNPMVLLMLFSVVMMVVMPNMMNNLDPEQKEQMKKQMEMQQDPSKMLSSLWSDLSGAASGGDGRKEVTEKKVIRQRVKRE